MTLPTWGDLWDNYCTIRTRVSGHEPPFSGTSQSYIQNEYYEDMAVKRYNYSSIPDTEKVRLVFLKSVLQDATNQTLVRQGRYLWCANLRYEGVNEDGLREVSFNLDKGHKRFKVAENSVLCLPSNSYVNNNKFFRPKDKTFLPFGSVFYYTSAVNMLAQESACTPERMTDRLTRDTPYKPGTLVTPRIGYFYPVVESRGNRPPSRQLAHPYGLVLGPSLDNNPDAGREFYRVRFGETTYERVHPVQMEVAK